MTAQQEFLEQLHGIFRAEAEELVGSISLGLANLERMSQSDDKHDLIDRIHRNAQALQGAARTVQLRFIELLGLNLENVFAEVATGRLQLVHADFEILHAAVDAAHRILHEQDPDEGGTLQLLARLQCLAARPDGPDPSPALVQVHAYDEVSMPEPAPDGQEDSTVAVSESSLDRVLYDLESIAAAAAAAAKHARVADAIRREVVLREQKTRHIAVEIHRIKYELDKGLSSHVPRGLHTPLQKLVEHFEDTQAHLSTIHRHARELENELIEHHQEFGRKIDGLVIDARQLVVQPFHTVLDEIPRIVADEAELLGKTVQLEMVGGNVDIDKRILDWLFAPLVELLRNRIREGIESTAERQRAGKPVESSMQICVSRINADQIEVSISDDGGGVTPPESVRALENEIEPFGGTVQVETANGRGSTLRIKLFSALAVSRALVVQSGEDCVALPASSVNRILEPQPDTLTFINGRPHLYFRGQRLPVYWLDELTVHRQQRTVRVPQCRYVAVVGSPFDRIGLAIDALLGEAALSGKSGMTLPTPIAGLQGGVPIVDVTSLCERAKSVSLVLPTERRTRPTASPHSTHSVLVAGSASTSRALFKNAYETGRFHVTAVNSGKEALAALENGEFELLVADLQMPELGGLEVTRRVRTHHRLRNLAVVLVGSQESDEDRRKCIGEGATAYVVDNDANREKLIRTVRQHL